MNTIIQKLPTLTLRIIAIMLAIVGVVISIFFLPSFGTAVADHFPAYAFWQYPILIGLYSAGVCFYFSLFHFWLLLNTIDRSGALSANNLKAIRLSMVVFSVLFYVFAMPIIFLAAEADDAPGAILIGAFLGTLPLGVAAVASILERMAGK